MTNELVAKDEHLSAAFARLRLASDRNHKVVPDGIDPTLIDFDCNPIENWRQSVEQWVHSTTLRSFTKDRMPTVQLMRRAIEKDARRIPCFPLTKRALRGPDQIRHRLLAGTSALNVTLSKYTDRAPTCPFGSCVGSVEDPIHFLLHCKSLEGPRATFLNRLRDRCTCDRRLGEGGERGCAEFFGGLDDVARALFMLGGPVDGRTPEIDIDACAREFVRCAWVARNSCLNQQAENPLVIDLVGSGKLGRGGTITSFFKPTNRAISAGPGGLASKKGVVAPSRSQHVQHTRRTRARIAQSTNGALGVRHRASGSGLNDSTYVMRSD